MPLGDGITLAALTIVCMRKVRKLRLIQHETLPLIQEPLQLGLGLTALETDRWGFAFRDVGVRE